MSTSSIMRDRAWISVPLVDDGPKRYARPSVLEVIDATCELQRLDELGALAAEEAPHVRVLLAVVGRLSGSDMAVAFHPDLAAPPRSRLHSVEGADR